MFHPQRRFLGAYEWIELPKLTETARNLSMQELDKNA